MGRDTTTGALVRYDACPPDWSAQEGPLEFGHWLLHTKQSVRQQVADGSDGRRVVWTRNRTVGTRALARPAGM